MVELADTMDLGSIAQACRFKSCRAYQVKHPLLLERVFHLMPFHHETAGTDRAYEILRWGTGSFFVILILD